MKHLYFFGIMLLASSFVSCDKNDDDTQTTPETFEWTRNANGPVYRDLIPDINYQVASDPHVFFENNVLQMIYSGDFNDNSSIKLATGSTWNTWTSAGTLLGETGPSGLDTQKETSFYRMSADGKHQIYYIGYENSETYEAQIFLAEADDLEGPYLQQNEPVVPKGIIAGKDVYCITSPSVVEHQGLLYMVFIGWNNSPSKVTEVWVLGATSSDEGHTWTAFQEVTTPIAMEGQVTKVNENEFVAVRTAEYGDKEAIFYATASHPFGPWDELEMPILAQSGPPYEKDEVIAPQITINPNNGREVLYYTGADYAVGWWVMMATR